MLLFFQQFLTFTFFRDTSDSSEFLELGNPSASSANSSYGNCDGEDSNEGIYAETDGSASSQNSENMYDDCDSTATNSPRSAQGQAQQESNRPTDCVDVVDSLPGNETASEIESNGGAHAPTPNPSGLLIPEDLVKCRVSQFSKMLPSCQLPANSASASAAFSHSTPKVERSPKRPLPPVPPRPFSPSPPSGAPASGRDRDANRVSHPPPGESTLQPQVLFMSERSPPDSNVYDKVQ